MVLWRARHALSPSVEVHGRAIVAADTGPSPQAPPTPPYSGVEVVGQGQRWEGRRGEWRQSGSEPAALKARNPQGRFSPTTVASESSCPVDAGGAEQSAALVVTVDEDQPKTTRTPDHPVGGRSLCADDRTVLSRYTSSPGSEPVRQATPDNDDVSVHGSKRYRRAPRAQTLTPMAFVGVKVNVEPRPRSSSPDFSTIICAETVPSDGRASCDKVRADLHHRQFASPALWGRRMRHQVPTRGAREQQNLVGMTADLAKARSSGGRVDLTSDLPGRRRAASPVARWTARIERNSPSTSLKPVSPQPKTHNKPHHHRHRFTGMRAGAPAACDRRRSRSNRDRLGDAKFDFEHCCSKGQSSVTLVVFPEQSGALSGQALCAGRRSPRWTPRHEPGSQQPGPTARGGGGGAEPDPNSRDRGPPRSQNVQASSYLLDDEVRPVRCQAR